MVHTSVPVSRTPTRQRIVNTALELFASQGITETTTRQIADFAKVNEVTLFRHFGNKHGLLLAVLQECLQKYLVLAQVGESLMVSDISSQGDLRRFLKYYIQNSLRALESVPELVRSLVGEAGQYPHESRQALAQGINQVNQTIANAIHEVLIKSRLPYPVPAIKVANLLNTCILGYAVITLTSDVQAVWSDRDEFVNTLVDMFVQEVMPMAQAHPIMDIGADTVREIMLQAKKFSVRDYAIAYLLFASGLTARDITKLRLSDYQHQGNHGILCVTGSHGNKRSVPLNQKILGHRYGSASNNPLSAYLKMRHKNIGTTNISNNISNNQTTDLMFGGDDRKPLALEEIEQLWERWTMPYRNADGTPLKIDQARHTWCLEMLSRGMDLDSFGIISGVLPQELAIYQARLNEKIAINRAIALDATC
ncbi:TetR family transcriptional regulator [Pseudanabaena sp. FACHB-1277]|jgi:AcrR family transcriptional regulator|uniref:TetR family transcriptional regulator n=1 Tax=Pseudanabaena cinerea FACHB-1277 TaxID=2949581 RepID=A0A926Z5D3_9CYAN|nr:TetR family transcriptional regulator [Pseudanabaena cinerea]MBD2150141.1 TetR family transcriptional regulator [Pseudanabaena cinerea FACHB-1277]